LKAVKEKQRAKKTMVLLFGPLVLRNGDSQLEGIFGEKGLKILSHGFQKT